MSPLTPKSCPSLLRAPQDRLRPLVGPGCIQQFPGRADAAADEAAAALPSTPHREPRCPPHSAHSAHCQPSLPTALPTVPTAHCPTVLCIVHHCIVLPTAPTGHCSPFLMPPWPGQSRAGPGGPWGYPKLPAPLGSLQPGSSSGDRDRCHQPSAATSKATAEPPAGCGSRSPRGH